MTTLSSFFSFSYRNWGEPSSEIGWYTGFGEDLRLTLNFWMGATEVLRGTWFPGRILLRVEVVSRFQPLASGNPG